MKQLDIVFQGVVVLVVHHNWIELMIRELWSRDFGRMKFQPHVYTGTAVRICPMYCCITASGIRDWFQTIIKQAQIIQNL